MLSLLQPVGNSATVNSAGWTALSAELDRLRVDILIIDPLISVMGGTPTNDNASAAMLMGRLVALAAEKGIAVVIAHHAAKGRDPTSAESAMGAASFVNLSRILLNIEPLDEGNADTLGIPPWEARSIFRIVGTKLNLSPPSESDEWYRISSVRMNNAEPPVYPDGDHVAVIGRFRPGSTGRVYPAALVRAALQAIDTANPPLSSSKNAKARYVVSVIRRAITPHRDGRSTDVEAEAVLKHLLGTGLVAVHVVNVKRGAGRRDERNGLVLTAAGKQTAHGEDNPA
jgi:hypothetical protein